MAKNKVSMTPAIRLLLREKVEFEDFTYAYEDKGGTAVSSRELGVNEHYIIKTLVMEDEHKKPLIVLMHGDRQVSTKKLARLIGVKSISPCSPETANKHTGYLVGGTSPFATRRALPVYMEKTIAELSRIYINGGKRGYVVSLDPREVIRILKPTLVQVGI